MNERVQNAINALILREGGYSNDPKDKGGETIYGITVAVARAFGYQGEMREMSRATAVQIFAERYWSQPGFDQVALASEPIAEELFDTGVNMGTGTAGKFLQRALNVLMPGPSLTVDGAIGKMTVYTLKQLLADRGAEGETVMLDMLNAQQSVRYMEIAENDESQERFEFGWQDKRVVMA